MKNVIIKGIVFFIVFAIFHFGYEWIPLAIFAKTESVWEHLKIGFFSILTVNFGEWLFLNISRKAYNRYQYILSRIISPYIVVGFIFLLFYLYVGLFGKLPSGIWGIIITTVITLISGIFTYYLESQIYYNFVTNKILVLIIIIILHIITIYLFIKFTYKAPYYPLFIEKNT